MFEGQFNASSFTCEIPIASVENGTVVQRDRLAQTVIRGFKGEWIGVWFAGASYRLPAGA